MSEPLSDLERDIEESRARLDRTIDRIQDRLTPRNLVDEMLGSARQTPLNGLYDSALDAVRRNPVPVLLIAAGIGMLLNRMAKGADPAVASPAPRATPPANAIPGARPANDHRAEGEAAADLSIGSEAASRPSRTGTLGETR